MEPTVLVDSFSGLFRVVKIALEDARTLQTNLQWRKTIALFYVRYFKSLSVRIESSCWNIKKIFALTYIQLILYGFNSVKSLTTTKVMFKEETN